MQFEKQFKEIEATNSVRVLWAAEVGSRLWGYSGPVSDHDVRFIYVHRPEWYFGHRSPVEALRLVDGDAEFNGWELRRALHLISDRNPTSIVSMRSSLIYRSHAGIADFFSKTCMRAADLISLQHFYVGLAKNKLQLVGSESEEIRLKPLLGAIHACLSCRSAIDNSALPPESIADLLDQTQLMDSCLGTVAECISKRSQGVELIVPTTATRELVEFIREKAESMRAQIADKPADSYGDAISDIGQLVQSICFEIWK